MRRNVSRVAAAAGLAVGMAGLAGALAPKAHAADVAHGGTSLPGIGQLIPTNPHELLPVHGATVDSLNWSGYAVAPGSGITAVTSQFKVPTASLLPPGFAATWAGIGGYKSQDLIQAGVGENSLVTNPVTGPQYYAWYELLPASETPISNCSGDTSCTVTPGDNVSVDISQASANTWNISMTDAGHWSWSKTVSYASSQSSAEWILEAPTVLLQTLLANVGTVHFGPGNTFTSGGTTHTIAQGNPDQVVLSPGLINEATPSALASDGESFNDCSYAQTCAAP